MKNLLNKIRKNNKGFTLVELIIVIAIIAILAAVLAPQYIQYVERARESNDASTAAAIRQAAVTACIDPACDVAAGEVVTVTWSTNGADGEAKVTVAGSTNGNGKVAQTIEDVVGEGVALTGAETSNIKFESKMAKTEDFVVYIKDGNATITTACQNWADAMDETAVASAPTAD